MSGRLSKWIIVVVLPVLLALYASYPPVPAVVRKARVEKKIAQTAEEAQAHGVSVGQAYPVGKSRWQVARKEEEARLHGVKVGQRYIAGETVYKRWLPLASGARELERRQIERRPDGTIVEEEITTIRGRVKLGLDVAGGTELLYELKGQKGQAVSENVASTIQVLKQRIDPSNVKEYRIQATENNRILIQVPAATAAEVEMLKNRLEKMGKLEFKVAVPRPGPDTEAKFVQMYEEARRGQVPEGYVKMYIDGDDSDPDSFYLVKAGEAEITGRYLSDVFPTVDEFATPAVGFTFNPVGARLFGQITENNRGWALAIILDGVLRSAPTIQERITGRGRITGRFTRQEVNDIVTVLKAGSLPMDIELLQESTVGPQLGRDSIRRGLLALAVAGILVLAFVGVYYLACGLVADAALIMNLVLLLGVLCILGAALTLPGMAGILLTVGMAVDANVLIFERIREEQAAGKGLRLALRNGYDRAFTTIVDANVTTLLTAVILYMIGTGPVRGFAVTLSFGILLSMFTALVVTRLALETFVEKGWVERFRMFAFFSQPTIKFSSLRRLAYVGSLSVVAVGLVAFAWRGSQLYDIDFTGGTLVELSLTKPTSISEVRRRLEEAGFERAQVQGIHTPSATEEGLTEFGVRVAGTGGTEVERTILPRVRESLLKAGIMRDTGDSLRRTPDGRGLALSVAEPVSEMAIRQALASGPDPYELADISTIESTDRESVTHSVALHFYNLPAMADLRDIWSRGLRALAWADLATRDYVIEELQPSADGASMELTLDKPLQWQVLATELTRRQFGALRVEPSGQEGNRFTLTGDRAVLERFARELPAGSHLLGVPDAQIDNQTVTASLATEFSEQDIRSFLKSQGLSDVYIVPLDVKAKEFRLELSYEDIRQKLRTAFADLAQRTASVSFAPADEQDASADTILVKMSLGEPMVLSTIKHYIQLAGLGPLSEGIIVGEGGYRPDVLISQLTLRLPRAKAQQMQELIAASFGEPQPVQKIVTIGPAVAKELQGRALLAVLFASVIIVLYVAVRFHAFRFGVAAVIALVHDLLITAGLIALADWAGVFGDVKINLAMLAAFLTILGYSLNDTIVVFDRIRENMGLLGRKSVSADLIDLSVNQTLSRTVLTSLTTLMVVVVLYLLGGAVFQGLALTLIIGVMVGTYSSVFVASPILLDWAGLVKGVRVFFRVLFFPVRLPFKLLALAGGRGR